MKLILTILFFRVFSAMATTYYVSNSGNDASNGLSTATAWQHISKVNSSAFVAGDSILFKRGDSWNETLFPPSSGIYFGAYGTGNKPVITGFQTASSWTDSSNIWSASIPNSVAYQNTVLADGVMTAKGRYPNSSYLTYTGIDAHTIHTRGTDSLTGTPNYTGAECAVRSAAYVIDVMKIDSQNVSYLYFNNATTYTPPQGTGYFIQNSKLVLDRQNEWCFDSVNKVISVYSVDTPNIQYSTIDTLIYLFKKDNITFEDLNIRGANSIGIDADSSKHITIQNCTINYTGGYNSKNFTTKGGQGGAGIRGENSVGLVVKNDSILNSLNNAVFAIHNSDSLNIENNYIANSGSLAGMGCNGNGAYTGIFIQGVSDTVINNQVINSGYIAVNFFGLNNLIKYNYIDTFCYVKDDGGGIYTTGVNTGTIIRKNSVLNGITAAQNPYPPNAAIGIYMDNSAKGILIDSNFVENFGTFGILSNHGKSLNFYDNTVVINNGTTCLDFSAIGNDTIFSKRNILYNSSGLTGVALYGMSQVFSNIHSDSNYFSRPLSDSLYKFQLGANYYTLSGWRTATGYDLASKSTPLGVTSATPLVYYNPTMSDSTISLNGLYYDSKGNLFNNSITIKPFMSAILYKSTSEVPVVRSFRKVGGILIN